MVDPGKKVVVIQTPNGIPFDMVVTAKTGITSGHHTLTLADLTRDANKAVSVKFTPERRGDVARLIQLNG